MKMPVMPQDFCHGFCLEVVTKPDEPLSSSREGFRIGEVRLEVQAGTAIREEVANCDRLRARHHSADAIWISHHVLDTRAVRGGRARRAVPRRARGVMSGVLAAGLCVYPEEDDAEEARDLTQGFFALLLEKNYLTAADRQRGKFRSFLLTAVKHFLSNERDRAHALKRGGGQMPVLIDLDSDGWHPPSARETVTPEVLFERRWALSVLEHVMTKLRSEFALSGKDAEFNKLLPFLNKSEDVGGYDTVATEMSVSAGALRMAVLRMRRRYRELMRSQIAETVSRPDEIDEEIRFLMSVLST